MRQPHAAARRLQTVLTSGEPRRAAPRRDESTCKLRRLLPTPSDDEVILAALKGLPVRDRPSWLIEYLVDVNHLPSDPVLQLRRRSTTLTQYARPSPITATGEPMVSTTLQSDSSSSEGGEANTASASPCALLMQTPVRSARSVSAEAAPAPSRALCGLVPQKGAEDEVAGGAVSGLGGNASPRVQQYRQEAFDLLAQLGCGQPSLEEVLPPPEPPDLRLLPTGFRIVQCSWDDSRLRQLNLQFAAEDAPYAVA